MATRIPITVPCCALCKSPAVEEVKNHWGATAGLFCRVHAKEVYRELLKCENRLSKKTGKTTNIVKVV